MREFEWASPLGAAVILFTVGAVIHLVIGLLTGVVFQLLPDGTDLGRRYLFLNEGPDRALFGGSPRALLDGDPTLSRFRAIVFTALAGVLVGFGIVELALVWFALKDGHDWALGALAISGFAMLPFFLACSDHIWQPASDSTWATCRRSSGSRRWRSSRRRSSAGSAAPEARESQDDVDR